MEKFGGGSSPLPVPKALEKNYCRKQHRQCRVYRERIDIHPTGHGIPGTASLVYRKVHKQVYGARDDQH